ncbi:MAG: hypothetical protein GXP50_02255, partial [Deltaproteobacteria bacterium]|nr:hypothetical protein [Deltaproteobacteria bacterium]
MTAKARVRAGRWKARLGETPLTFYRAWCKKCGICIAFCPKNVLDRGSDGHPAPVR